MSEIWRTCCKAQPLALGFGGTFRRPSQVVKRLANEMASFQVAFKDLEFVLKRENTTVEWIDGFRQTFDECNDFLFDFQALQDGRDFDKRPTGFPDIPYTMGRYMYTDAEIAFLGERVGLQLNVMHAKMDDIVL